MKKDFLLEEDFAISGECEDCENYTENADDLENGSCSECGGNLILETSHEGCECDKCGKTFDMWDVAYRGNDDELICETCYNELDD